ncbi:uncharacterized protein BX663DRAFT_512475 [Cokeromyces recurvatus]|uniref:uncharacterized protein n=1 Tax=Cokeromyces recurvatus TaxID=90255 RepID=UPI0022206273|nr:uncharacterized protein BX663DRAFT_512475 [Cokeromyces recurvatus]KAI7901804.1 hypothetical protein BX663DRAFT_512475 [Cokeromyces recurvatus]
MMKLFSNQRHVKIIAFFVNFYFYFPLVLFSIFNLFGHTSYKTRICLYPVSTTVLILSSSIITCKYTSYI